MGSREKIVNQKLAEFLFVIKILSLFFSVVAYLQHFYSWVEVDNINYGALLLLLLAIFSIMAFMYLSFWYAYKQHQKSGRTMRSIIRWAEYIVITAVFISAIMISGSYNSQYKILFIFLIVSNTLEYGMKSGLYTAGVSSAILFAIDFLFPPAMVVNNYFENDILLSGVFVVTAWAVGFYFKTQDQMISDLKELINIDNLTGLYNHRYFHEQLHYEFDQAKEDHQELSLLCMDIDHFKVYNEIFGHQQGDKVLQEIAGVLRDQTPDQALIARYGGQEFSVILPKTTQKQAVSLAETIRHTIEQYPFTGQEHMPEENLTVSVSVASLKEHHIAYTDLLQDANDALYRAKVLRRNSVEAYISIFEQLHEQDKSAEFTNTISSIKTLIAVIDSRDKYTYGHVERVVTYMQILADHLDLSPEDRKRVIYGAYMHDVGKINIQREILMKSTKLTDEEWFELQQHPKLGTEIVENIDYLRDIVPLILQHHERFDGKGYPQGLAGDELDPLARALTVVDSFDAMTSRRPYQKTKSFAEALDELRRCSGTQFDPYYVDQFIEAILQYKNKKDIFANL